MAQTVMVPDIITVDYMHMGISHLVQVHSLKLRPNSPVGRNGGRQRISVRTALFSRPM